MKAGGWLFVSSTETLTHDEGVLALVEVDGAFCYRKVDLVAFGDRRTEGLAPANLPAPATASAGRPSDPASEVSAERADRPANEQMAQCPQRTSRPGFDGALTLAREKRYDEALARIDEFLLAEPSFVKGHMLKAGILVDLRRTDEARRACLLGLQEDRWCLEGHLLLGLMARAEESDGEAIDRFREAIYIQPSCWLAHFHLAQIQAARREVANARREYEVVMRLLGKGSLSGHGLTFFPLAFPAGQVMNLCRHNLATLERAG
jgi:chemotaxis protein methyltransferase CheR